MKLRFNSQVNDKNDLCFIECPKNKGYKSHITPVRCGVAPSAYKELIPCGRLPQFLLPLRLIVFRKSAAVIRLHSLSTNSFTSLIEDIEVLLELAKAIFLLFGFVVTFGSFFLAVSFGDFRVFLVRSLFRSFISFFCFSGFLFLGDSIESFLAKSLLRGE